MNTGEKTPDRSPLVMEAVLKAADVARIGIAVSVLALGPAPAPTPPPMRFLLAALLFSSTALAATTSKNVAN